MLQHIFKDDKVETMTLSGATRSTLELKFVCGHAHQKRACPFPVKNDLVFVLSTVISSASLFLETMR